MSELEKLNKFILAKYEAESKGIEVLISNDCIIIQDIVIKYKASSIMDAVGFIWGYTHEKQN